MHIQISGAAEHNLKDVDVAIGDGLTVVTGVSGSGKTSLVFDTLYHEARRRFLDIFAPGSNALRMPPANVRSISGLGPAIAVGQNLLNRNPSSTLATASGLHPFLRLLYANFGERPCPRCGRLLEVMSEDAIVERMVGIAGEGPLTLLAPLVKRSMGSQRTLLGLLADEYGADKLVVDGRPWDGQLLDATQAHDIDVVLARVEGEEPARAVREVVRTIAGLGAHALIVQTEAGRVATKLRFVWAFRPVCVECGTWFGEVRPTTFHRPCPQCSGAGCPACDGTGLHPLAARVRWQGLRLADFLASSVDQAYAVFHQADTPSTAARLITEITRRLDALQSVGLGYIALDRGAPTLSRGEAQRVRLAVALSSRLEDMLHVLDEPTIGQHPADVGRLVDAFRRLAGPVVFVEHDRIAAAAAAWALDIGPGAGGEGGSVVFAGTPAGLWQADTPTGRFFSLRDRVPMPPPRPEPEAFLILHGAQARNLRGIDVPVPLGRLTVITGVSGSGKSTLVEEVLVASLEAGKPTGCQSIDGPLVKPVWVDQSPIGHNPRSNPATYTKLADIIRDVFAAHSGLPASYFSFNRPEGACPVCEGLGAVEVKMRYMPSTWITCSACGGQRFSEEVLAQHIGGLSIADFYQLSIQEGRDLFENNMADLSPSRRRTAISILNALCDVGLGYLPLGQPSPTLSGGEAQRVKLAKTLGRPDLHKHLLVLDEPSTGLHPHDLAGLLTVLGRLVHAGATVVVVEHNTDVIRAADWVIDLGPGAGPDGGQLLYAGHPAGLVDVAGSLTGQAMRDEEEIKPLQSAVERNARSARRIHPHPNLAALDYPSPVGDGGGGRRPVGVHHATISIRDARANNLKGVDVDFPKGALTVVTGVSGSGKSSLVIDVLEAEAHRRFLETLSLYERQSTREGPEAPVGSVSGLGVSVSITPTRALYNRRATVGSATEVAHHLAVVFAAMGDRACLECGASMQRGAEIQRGDVWHCPACGSTAPVANSRHFSASSYAAACTHCHGVGSMQIPAPEKLIIAPDKPLCTGAMYSPGFFPNGYLGKPFNGGYYLVRALAERYGFDPDATPWNEMGEEAQQVFLFGSDEVLQVTYENRTGQQTARPQSFPGFYGWIRDWDVGGTYTRTEPCPACGGSRLRPDYLAVTLAGSNVHQMGEMTLIELLDAVQRIDKKPGFLSYREPQVAGEKTRFLASGYDSHPALGSLDAVRRRLRFLVQVGLGYLNLHRVTATLSAGEAQRIKLAGLLGSGLVSLTVLLDEPSRGMHPSEVEALLAALAELRDEGNTVIVVEHDPLFMQAADHLIEVGPGAGIAGGQIVAQGPPAEFLRASGNTARWLRGERQIALPAMRRSPRGWMSIEGARTNNLRRVDVRLPLGVLVGVCGVSGSGKSTLLLDTLGRALVPRKQTTSVAYEPVDPGEHDAINGAPARAILLDQSRRGIDSPMTYLNLSKPLVRLYAESEEAQALNLDERALTQACSVCRGRGETRIDMGFLPDVHVPCDACRGTGCAPEAWEVRLHGIALPACNTLTVEEIDELFGGDDEALRRVLATVRAVGLGYLVMRQPGYTLSSGEAQRLKIASELCRKTSQETLYILDEPTVGQSLEDIQMLVGVLHRLVDEGHSVVVVEHHPHLLAACDWLIELGPGGGPDGGQVIAEGTPEEVAVGDTPTARYVRDVMRKT